MSFKEIQYHVTYLPLLLSSFLVLSLVGCDNQKQDSSELFKTLDRQLSDLKKGLKDSMGQNDLDHRASSELEKLFTFEYKVVDLPSKASSVDLEKKLKKLGAERWECFSIRQISDKIQIACKRRPKTYLRYIPRVF